MCERFTRDARDTVQRAHRSATEGGGRSITSEHLLLALAADPESVAGRVLLGCGATESGLRALVSGGPGAGGLLSAADADALRSVGIDLDAVLARIDESFGPDALAAVGADLSHRRRRSPRFDTDAKRALEGSLREAVRLRQREINTGHLLLGLLRDRDGRGCRLLVAAGLAPAEVSAATEAALLRAA